MIASRSCLLNSPSPPFVAPAAVELDSLRWHNSFAHLPAGFYTRLDPTPLPAPYPIAVSEEAAALLGLDPEALSQPEAVAAFAGNRVLPGSTPVAAVYAGHQFGVYVPQLGDGRAHLLGGVVGPDGRIWELQLKGAGKTPYSRFADGRAVLRSSIREFLCSEAMAGLGVPTTRALTLIGSDTPVFRETAESAALVTRMAPSFLRFGSFEFFYWHNRHEELRQLADYAIDNFFPECRDARQPYLAWLQEVARRTARLIAHWQAVGFMHGVMNSDNMSLLGLTLDYGPFGFMDGFDAHHSCNHSDEHGRYAYDMQPKIGHWNLHCLGQAVIPLTEDVEATQAVLGTYLAEYAEAAGAQMRAKLGFTTQQPDDDALIEPLLALLDANRADWTIFWRKLAQLRVDAAGDAADAPVRDLFADRAALDAWAVDYRARLRREASVDAERAARMNRVNPKYVLRNYLAEDAIRKARGDEGARDFGEVERLLHLLRRPYDEQPEFDAYARLPPDWAAALHLSCSS
jgi:uncharacterized protein YdiU (UPF0061 family)